MKILFLSRWFPFPANNGSKIRIYNLLRGLSRYHEVTLLSFSSQPIGSFDAEVGSICTNVHLVPWREFNPNSLRARIGFLSSKPRSIIDTFSPAMAGKISRLLQAQPFDLVVASELSMAAYRPYFKHVPAIFEDLEIGLTLEGSPRRSDWRNQFRHALTRFKLRFYLRRLLQSFPAITVVSNQEKDLVQRNFPKVKNILVIPNCINLDDYRDIRMKPKSDTLIFTGSFRYHANHEAMHWFVGEVFPLVLEKLPSVELTITGDHANLPLPSRKNVTLAGYVDNIQSLIASSMVALAPLWSGGGTRLKILEAMAIGTPVIATSKGAEGLEVQSGKHLLIADQPAQFAASVIRLLSEKDVRQNLTQNARELVQDKYDWAMVMPEIFKFIEQLVGK